MSFNFGFGQRMLFDAHQRFVKSGLCAYLRIRLFLDNENDGTSSDYLEVGQTFEPQGVAAADTGYSDILISPPASTFMVSSKNISDLPGLRLNFSSRIFEISHTFVNDQMNTHDISDPREVFRERDGHPALGIYYLSRLYSIEAIIPRESCGEIIKWRLMCNDVEVPSVSN